MVDLTNAKAILIEPIQTIGTDLQATHSETRHAAVRCSLRALSVTRAIGVLGKVALNGWTLRLRTKLPVAPGWRVEATVDGESASRTYVVAKVAGGLHTVLTLEGA